MEQIVQQVAKIWRYAIFFVFLTTLLLALPRPTRADMGPKPSMVFTLVYHIDPPPAVTDGVLLECSTAGCADAEPLPEMGPQQFTCQNDNCSSLAYGYKPYHRLWLRFADGTVRESNVFGKKYFEARYQVTVEADRLVVTEQRGGVNAMGWIIFGSIAGSCLAVVLAGAILVILVALVLKARWQPVTFATAKGWLLAIWGVSLPFLLVGGYFSPQIPATIALELLVAAAVAMWRKQPAGRLLSVVLLANVITLPALWLALNAAATEFFLPALIVGEVAVWGAETAIICAILRPDYTWRSAALLSLLLNGSSLLLGLLLPF